MIPTIVKDGIARNVVDCTVLQQNSNRTSIEYQQNIKGRKQHEHQSDFSDSTLYYI